METSTNSTSTSPSLRINNSIPPPEIGENDSLEPEDEKILKLRLLENDVKLPMIVFFLTFIFPPLGFVMFLPNRSLNRASLRYKWFNRSLILGSALSVIYAYILCSLLHHYVFFAKTDDILGYSYGTEIKA
ncbi:hypothetical protein BEWA_018410 [Theileria equi strain WA]|uniref:Uncharacterized protein n=1 Tax=Theileria equi strain WA TaxID=1537102 RepID=L0AVF5_THEEQ|nr:hypothetical protein BEWA_018410 [Theileria equi strain WA]AFZ78996.1 hypothetical protein BEWA_018410 [Theileria equi strain WA]|eukprot:XP_004828662.1 hypothetical protein BEWA_018410 [Theileria equi strain WA]